MTKDKNYSIVVKLGKKPTPAKLRLAAIELRGVADKLAGMAERAEAQPL